MLFANFPNVAVVHMGFHSKERQPEQQTNKQSFGQRSADKMAAYFFALEEIVVNFSLVFCSV